MKRTEGNNTEQLAALAFTHQSKTFDEQYATDTIIRYKRSRVREHFLQYLPPAGTVLELSSGTGEDALFLAGLGYHVHATDISTGMQEVLKDKIGRLGVDRISLELCSFTGLGKLRNKGPYDAVFSNFGGLNCTGDLKKVLKDINPLLKPGGIMTLVIISRFCLWESLLVFKGKFGTATRRFFSRSGRAAKIDGRNFTCWYYAPSFIIRELKMDFELLGIEGLCTLVPPSYLEHFAEKHQRLYAFLKNKEDRLKNKWPWRSMGDYFIISLKKRWITD